MSVMRITRQALALAVVIVLVAVPAGAQRVDRPQGRPGAPLQEPGLQREFRERLAEVVRRRLNLNDSQMQQLGRVNDRFERERVALLRDERRARQALRAEVLAGDSSDQQKIAGSLDELLRIQRTRVDLIEREQRELATFMTPRQRAMYFGIQDELRQRLEELRQQRQQRRGPMQGRRPPL